MMGNYLLVPVAIREDATVRIHFPADITAEEAEKVARVIRAYAPCGERPQGQDAQRLEAKPADAVTAKPAGAQPPSENPS